jgi:hypothetical protein
MKSAKKEYPKNDLIVLTVIVVLAAIGGIVILYNNHRNSISDSVKIERPANIASCSSINRISAPEFVGLSLDRAAARAKYNDMIYRVVSVDGKSQPVNLVGAKCGYAVNFTIVNDKVTKAEYY